MNRPKPYSITVGSEYTGVINSQDKLRVWLNVGHQHFQVGGDYPNDAKGRAMCERVSRAIDAAMNTVEFYHRWREKAA